MAKGKRDEQPIIVDNFSDVNKIIGKVLEEIARQFSEYEPDNENRVVYGLNLRTGPDGKPVQVNHGTENFVEPLIDLIERGKETTIIAAVPGASKKDLKIIAASDNVKIEIKTPQINYSKTINLNSKVNPKAKSAKLTNGVLEIIFGKSTNSNKESIVEL